MLYPLKFKPVYKDYIWGGRGLEKLGKVLPKEGIVAESWEVSCHPDGVSIVANGEYEGVSLPELIELHGRDLIGNDLPEKDLKKFPLLVKLIDANEKLSVQVHPDDNYALTHENGEYGKNEAWYVISAKPGAKLVCGTLPGVTKETFIKAYQEGNLDSCLNYIEVFSGDVINIPAGLIHAIGEGILIAEIQQNSNTTYRVYDYDRVDKYGNKRPLHFEKALDVINFDLGRKKNKVKGLNVMISEGSLKTYLIANEYFAIEKYLVSGLINEDTRRERFHIYVFLEGNAEFIFGDGNKIKAKMGESVLIPASIGSYYIKGSFKALKTYVPNLQKDIVDKLKEAGYTEEQILKNIEGLSKALYQETKK